MRLAVPGDPRSVEPAGPPGGARLQSAQRRPLHRPWRYGGNYAATEIAQLLGIDPKSLSPTQSWAQFAQQIESGPEQAKLNNDPALAKTVDELAAIADQPQPQRVSTYSWGGTPDGIYKQTVKDFCQIGASDPGTIPIFTTYFLHPNLGGCSTTSQIDAYMPRFKSQIDAMAKATGRHAAVFLLELDAIGSSSCMARLVRCPLGGGASLRDERDAVASAYGRLHRGRLLGFQLRPLHRQSAQRHRRQSIRGFFTNDTHNQWTSHEVSWATKIAAKTHGAHFIVNTSDNGRGPVLNPHPTTQGVEDPVTRPGGDWGSRTPPTRGSSSPMRSCGLTHRA